MSSPAVLMTSHRTAFRARATTDLMRKFHLCPTLPLRQLSSPSIQLLALQPLIETSHC